MLSTIVQANARIARGAPLIIAGSRAALAELNAGNWIGGSIPYFMTADGGCADRTQVFIEEIKLPVVRSSILSYGAKNLASIPVDAYANGFSYVIIPANSSAHFEYALHAPNYPEIFMKPVIGWISGVHLDDLAKEVPVVIDGRTRTVLADQAIVLHVELPPESQVMVQTVNLFQTGKGPALRFKESGFSASTALVNGKEVDLASFMKQEGWNPCSPLVADYAGTHVNVSIKAVDEKIGVSFYAPVFAGVDYHEAAPVADYVEAFARQVPAGIQPVLSCNCILNYLFGKLEGRRTGPFTGPVTFGEIAHQLLNQTLVYLEEIKSS